MLENYTSGGGGVKHGNPIIYQLTQQIWQDTMNNNSENQPVIKMW